MAAVPVRVQQSHIRDNWSAALERAGLKGVRLSDLQRLRSKLLAEAKDRPGVRLLKDEAQEDARLLAQALQVLALSEDQGRGLLLREVPG
jgi:hypothetical protein